MDIHFLAEAHAAAVWADISGDGVVKSTANPFCRTRPINATVRISPRPDSELQPRAHGHVHLSVKRDGPRTAIDTLRQAGSSKLLFPRRTGPEIEAVLLNTAGGVTGGDRFAVDIEAQSGTAMTLTTQAAERAYAAQPGETGVIRSSLLLGEDVAFNWLPQETILFAGCALDRSLAVEMAASSRLLVSEILVFGRGAMGETLTCGTFLDRIEVRRGGEKLFLDAIALHGNIAAHLERAAIAAGSGAMVSVVYVAPDAEAYLGPLRAMLPETAGVSLIGADLLFLRALAQDSFALRQMLIPILVRLTKTPLPRCWMI
ncbi:urease accessory protein UreD [Marimonas arenosa]|uniref:Urease accessory protein UreD n=1 Tax=Marimonas arenosa TaxID=1795305 RepID=A0AAE4B533_9RHOB|nr:urease accessory protein UreD [Marimonas arenosa]MDQ2090860.1 urease accessory protein UreD [Marimonas arenosa]